MGTFTEGDVDKFRVRSTNLRVSSLREVAAVASKNENLPVWYSKHSHSRVIPPGFVASRVVAHGERLCGYVDAQARKKMEVVEDVFVWAIQGA